MCCSHSQLIFFSRLLQIPQSPPQTSMAPSYWVQSAKASFNPVSLSEVYKTQFLTLPFSSSQPCSLPSAHNSLLVSFEIGTTHLPTVITDWMLSFLMKPVASWACLIPAEGTGHGLQEAEACWEEGKGVWCALLGALGCVTRADRHIQQQPKVSPSRLPISQLDRKYRV